MNYCEKHNYVIPRLLKCPKCMQEETEHVMFSSTRFVNTRPVEVMTRETYERKHKVQLDMMKQNMEEGDWHGVWDGAIDMALLERAWEAQGGK